MQKFTDLRVWQSARRLALGVYEATGDLPASERFGLSAQLRRATVSVLANIAEGSKREHRPDYARFLNVAEASLAEVECLLILCGDLKLIRVAKLNTLRVQADGVARMLSGLRRAVTPGTQSHS